MAVWLVFGCSRRNTDGQTAACRRIVETNRTIAAAGACQAQGWPAAGIKPAGADWHLVRAAHRLSLGVFSPGTGLWVGHDLLATLARLARGRRVGKNLAGAARRTGAGRRDRLVESGDRQLLGASAFWGRKPAPIPRIAAKMARSGMLPAMVRGRRWRSRTPARTSTIRKPRSR